MFGSNLEAARIERRGLGRWLLPRQEGSDRVGRDRRQQDPIAVVAARNEKAFPLADQRSVVRRSRAEAGRSLDDLEVADGGYGPDRLAEEQFGGGVGRRVVEAGVLDRRAEHSLATRTGDDVDLLALNDPRRRQRASEAKGLALHRPHGQALCQSARRPGACGEDNAVSVDAGAICELDASGCDIDNIGVGAQCIADLRDECIDGPPRVDLGVLREQPAAAAVLRDAGLERAACLAIQPFAVVLADVSVERQDERAAPGVARISELAGECRPELRRGLGKRLEARRLRVRPEHSCGCARGTAARCAPLEDAHTQPTLLRTPCGRESDDPAAHDRRVVLLHHADDSVAAVNGLDRRARLARSRLYLVLEARPHGDDPSALLEAALRGGVDVVQLRDKELQDDELVRAAEPFRRACDRHGALFVLNDRPGLVERANADGVHVGREDVSFADARRAVGPDRLAGLSASTVDELQGDPDYFGVGAVFGTPTKPDADPGGLELVRAARDRLRVPWFAIGGIDADTIQDVVASGAAGVAVVRAIRDAADPEGAARALRALLPPTDAVVVEGDKEIRLPQIDWLEWSLPAGESGARPHTHLAHTDVFYVLAGEIEMRLGGETVRLPAGSCVAAPPPLLHGFRNPGATEARYLNMHAPGGWASGRRRLAPEEFDTAFGADTGSARVLGIITGPGDGDPLRKEHRLALVKVQRPELDVLEYFVDDEYDGASKHVHLRHTDCFHVLEGELEVTADGHMIRARPGTAVVIPPGVEHAFTSVGRARFLNVHAPSYGFSDYLRKVAAGEEVEAELYDSHPLD